MGWLTFYVNNFVIYIDLEGIVMNEILKRYMMIMKKKLNQYEDNAGQRKMKKKP